MAEEEKQEPQQEPETEQPAADAAPEEAPPEEVAAEGTPPEEAATEEPAAAGEAPPADQEEPLTPKQRRKRERSRATEPARPERSVEERASERAELRSRKAADRTRWRRKRREKRQAAPPTSQAPTAAEPHERGARKVRRGVVVSSKPDKTITVRIDAVRPHPLYGKVIRNTGTLHAHDEGNQANEGDVVRIVECRPLSRTKRWRLLEVLERAQ
jgi:small subunit ribosomal protein S17